MLAPGSVTGLDREADCAIDRIHDILRQLARRPFPDGVYRDESGDMRLVVPTPTWDDYVLLATEEITLAGLDQSS
jgi:uncharacterized membrane protein